MKIADHLDLKEICWNFSKIFSKNCILASLSIQEKLMITSDEQAEYNVLDLFSDIGGGLGIFLGLSIMRSVNLLEDFISLSYDW